MNTRRDRTAPPPDTSGNRWVVCHVCGKRSRQPSTEAAGVWLDRHNARKHSQGTLF